MYVVNTLIFIVSFYGVCSLPLEERLRNIFSTCVKYAFLWARDAKYAGRSTFAMVATKLLEYLPANSVAFVRAFWKRFLPIFVVICLGGGSSFRGFLLFIVVLLWFEWE